MHPFELTGILGWAERVITALVEWGVGLLVLVETVFPPLPSEVVLPLAGFLSSQGTLSVPLVILTSTLGAYLGALGLYSLGAALGQDRSIRLLSKLPLVDRDDFERTDRWFARHGKASVFFGRLIPGVRSLISLPAGAQRMSLPIFTGLHRGRQRDLERCADRAGRGPRDAVRTGQPLLAVLELRGVRGAGRPGGLVGRPPGSTAEPLCLTEVIPSSPPEGIQRAR